jgi:hypothetical protein
MGAAIGACGPIGAGGPGAPPSAGPAPAGACASVEGSWRATTSLDGGKTMALRLTGTACAFAIADEVGVALGSGTGDGAALRFDLPYEATTARCTGAITAGEAIVSATCTATGADGVALDYAVQLERTPPDAPPPDARAPAVVIDAGVPGAPVLDAGVPTGPGPDAGVATTPGLDAGVATTPGLDAGAPAARVTWHLEGRITRALGVGASSDATRVGTQLVVDLTYDPATAPRVYLQDGWRQTNVDFPAGGFALAVAFGGLRLDAGSSSKLSLQVNDARGGRGTIWIADRLVRAGASEADATFSFQYGHADGVEAAMAVPTACPDEASRPKPWSVRIDTTVPLERDGVVRPYDVLVSALIATCTTS